MRIPILFAGNEAVFDGMVISTLSIVKYCKEPLDLFLLTMDLTTQNSKFLPITEQHRAYLSEVCRAVNPESRVYLLDVGEYYRATMLHSPNAETGYTPYCFLRLYADRFSEIPDKAIYLDTDTMLCGDISRLYEENVDDYELAGVRDRYGHCFFGFNYINSGVLLLNLAKIRETRLFRRVIALCAKKKIFLPDQSAINSLATRKRILPVCYNEQKSERKDTLVRHFSMTIRWLPRFHTQNVKPWQIERMHELLNNHLHDDILEDYLQRKKNFPNMQKERTK